jgi:hypothetical protein
LLIDLDNGPEIASSRTQFMKRLVEFSDQHHLTLELAYYPPYHSKYNLIERCWGILENHWNGTLFPVAVEHPAVVLTLKPVSDDATTAQAHASERTTVRQCSDLPSLRAEQQACPAVRA